MEQASALYFVRVAQRSASESGSVGLEQPVCSSSTIIQFQSIQCFHTGSKLRRLTNSGRPFLHAFNKINGPATPPEWERRNSSSSVLFGSAVVAVAVAVE